MDAVDIIKVCFRRWYVMLPILIGAAGVSFQLVQSQEPTYTAATSYGLVQPGGAGSAGGGRNPLGTDDSALIGAALEAQLNSRRMQEELGSEHTRGWGPGEAENGLRYSVKIPMFETTYEIRAWGADEREVEAVVNRVIKAAPRVADEIQDRAGAPASLRYEPFVLAPTQVDALPSTSAVKLVVAVMGVGVLLGAAWSIVADRLLRRPRRKRHTTAGGTRGPGGARGGHLEPVRPGQDVAADRPGGTHPGKASPRTGGSGSSGPASTGPGQSGQGRARSGTAPVSGGKAGSQSVAGARGAGGR